MDLQRLDSQAGELRGDQVAADEQDYTANEVAFMMAMDVYKRDNRRPFPTWSEVLAVLESLGWQRTSPAGPLPLNTRHRRRKSNRVSLGLPIAERKD